MKKLLIIIVLFSWFYTSLYSQEERKIIREGNKLYRQEQYDKAELKYKKALEINPSEKQLNNNIGASQYRNNTFNDAVSSYENIINSSNDNNVKADAYYNIGNSYLQAGEYDKSIDSYRNALRLNPEHDLSRYNMAVATKAKIQNQSQDNQGDGENGEKGEESEQQQQQENNKGDESEDQQDNDQNNDENNEKDQQEQSDKPQQQEPQDNKMSKEEMERFLESLQEKEKEVQDKVNKDKFKNPQRRNIEKEW